LKVAISNRQRHHQIDRKKLRKTAEKILSDLGYPDSELSLVIVGDLSIRRLNRLYLGRDKATNVISFAMQEGPFLDLNPQLLGDVVISSVTCAREAADAGISFSCRLHFLLLHGMLHLVGYDHERSGAAEALRMEEKEREIVACLEKEGLM